MNRQSRLGLLVVTGVVLFMLAVALIANRGFILSDTLTVSASFESIGGLPNGSPVHFRGVPIGRVDEVILPNNGVDAVELKLEIKESATHLLNSNSVARLDRDGPIGIQLISIETPGAGSAIQEGAMLRGIEGMDLNKMGQSATEVLQSVSLLSQDLQALMNKVEGGEGTLGKITQDPELYDGLVEMKNSMLSGANKLQGTLSTLDAVSLEALEASQGVDALVDGLVAGKGIGALLNDTTLFVRINRLSARLEDVSDHLENVLTQSEAVISFGTLAASRAAENMEAMRRNWLFRKYFKEEDKNPGDESLELRAIEEALEAIEIQREELRQWEESLKEQEIRQTDQ